MRRELLPLLCVSLIACGDDEKSTPDASDTADVADTTSDTTSPDTTVPDTTAPDTTAPDTTVPDTTQPDTTQPDTVQPVIVGICPGISACAELCANSGCVDDCLDAADSESERTLATTYLGCLTTNTCSTSAFPTEEEAKAATECERTNCLADRTACESGETHGGATCRATAQCLQACGEDDLPCRRACFAAATELAATAFFDLDLCLERECSGAVNFQTCAQQATSSVGPCSLTYNGCYGDTGAAPGAGGGGGLPAAD